MRRFFTQQTDGDTARIDGEDVRHIARVLRMKPGDALTLCDGRGLDYDARIMRIDGDGIVCAITGSRPSGAEPRCRVTLFQGLPKAGKLETIVQKCTELGVSAVVPLETRRCDVKLSREFESRRQRLMRVAYEAAKQARRGAVPEILPPVGLACIDPSAFDLTLIAYEDERARSLKAALRSQPDAVRIALIVGPEGGFDEAEITDLTRRGALSVSLGPRILRTETAGMAMLAQILYETEADT